MFAARARTVSPFISKLQKLLTSSQWAINHQRNITGATRTSTFWCGFPSSLKSCFPFCSRNYKLSSRFQSSFLSFSPASLAVIGWVRPCYFSELDLVEGLDLFWVLLFGLSGQYSVFFLFFYKFLLDLSKAELHSVQALHIVMLLEKKHLML